MFEKGFFSEGIPEENKAGILFALGIQDRAEQRGLESSITPQGTVEKIISTPHLGTMKKGHA